MGGAHLGLAAPPHPGGASLEAPAPEPPLLSGWDRPHHTSVHLEAKIFVHSRSGHKKCHKGVTGGPVSVLGSRSQALGGGRGSAAPRGARCGAGPG